MALLQWGMSLSADDTMMVQCIGSISCDDSVIHKLYKYCPSLALRWMVSSHSICLTIAIQQLKSQQQVPCRSNSSLYRDVDQGDQQQVPCRGGVGTRLFKATLGYWAQRNPLSVNRSSGGVGRVSYFYMKSLWAATSACPLMWSATSGCPLMWSVSFDCR